jgi:hypothetical protein
VDAKWAGQALEENDMPNDGLQREVLPVPDIPPVGLTTYDAKDPATSYPPITPLRPPVGAPNLLVVLLDDVGFGAASAFGGPCQTPTFERLASNGLKYTRFHTTALCSPTRAALLSGRNHHSVGMGGITEIATSAPGYNSLRPNTKATVQETLRLNGMRPPSSASATRCRCGRPARRGRLSAGRPGPALSTSMASSPARPASGIRPCMIGCGDGSISKVTPCWVSPWRLVELMVQAHPQPSWSASGDSPPAQLIPKRGNVGILGRCHR